MKVSFLALVLAGNTLLGEPVSEFSLILNPSPNGGIGVFATHLIPKGTNIFPKKHPYVVRKILEVPPPFLKYCVFLNEDECLTPLEFDRMDIGWYLNHSNTPNTLHLSEEELIAIRDIQAGEEVLMNYNELGEPEKFKEAYYHSE